MGVDLEFCVHAHGHDVDPIMEASCNYFLDIISFGIGELILCNRDSDHDCSPLIPLLRQDEVLVFCRSFHVTTVYSALPSSITLWYLEDITELHNFL